MKHLVLVRGLFGLEAADAARHALDELDRGTRVDGGCAEDVGDGAARRAVRGEVVVGREVGGDTGCGGGIGGGGGDGAVGVGEGDGGPLAGDVVLGMLVEGERRGGDGVWLGGGATAGRTVEEGRQRDVAVVREKSGSGSAHGRSGERLGAGHFAVTGARRCCAFRALRVAEGVGDAARTFFFNTSGKLGFEALSLAFRVGACFFQSLVGRCEAGFEFLNRISLLGQFATQAASLVAVIVELLLELPASEA